MQLEDDSSFKRKLRMGFMNWRGRQSVHEALDIKFRKIPAIEFDRIVPRSKSLKPSYLFYLLWGWGGIYITFV